MRKLLIVSLITLLASCQQVTDLNELVSEKSEVVKEAEYLGKWVGRCYCCQGYLIQIERKTYAFKELPDGSPDEFFDRIAYTDLPIEVNVRYENSDPCGSSVDFITVSNIEKSE